LQPVVLLQFLDTPGDEVTPRSDKIGEYVQDQGLRHDFLLYRGSKITAHRNCLVRLKRLMH
jgi:hypothetical protein